MESGREKMDRMYEHTRTMKLLSFVVLCSIQRVDSFGWSSFSTSLGHPGSLCRSLSACPQYRPVLGRGSLSLGTKTSKSWHTFGETTKVSVQCRSTEQETGIYIHTSSMSNSSASRHVQINPQRQPGNGTSLRLSLLQRRVASAERAVVVSQVRKIQKETSLAENRKMIRALSTRDVEWLKNKRGRRLRTEMSQKRIVRAQSQVRNVVERKEVLDLFVSASSRALSRGLMEPESPLRTSVLAGNKGFDPCCVASRDLWSGERLPEADDSSLVTLAESEIRHARLAMLAIVGGPASETIEKTLEWDGWGLSRTPDFEGQKFMVGALAVFLVSKGMCLLSREEVAIVDGGAGKASMEAGEEDRVLAPCFSWEVRR